MLPNGMALPRRLFFLLCCLPALASCADWPAQIGAPPPAGLDADAPYPELLPLAGLLPDAPGENDRTAEAEGRALEAEAAALRRRAAALRTRSID